MYRDGYLSYNQEATNEAINSSMKAENISKNSNKIRSISVPSTFKSSGRLSSVLSDIDKTLSNIASLPSTLKEMQNILEDYIDDTSLELTNELKGFNYVELGNGNRGYLYIPEGYSSTRNLPMMVYLAGQGEDSTNPTNGKTKSLGYLLNNGYNLDSVVFIPIGRSDCWESSSTLQLIDSVANQYKVDKNRISLIGHSWGAYVGYKMIIENPNYFSSFVPFGGYCRELYSKEMTQTLANSETTFIIFQSHGDMVYEECKNTFETLKSNGAQVVMYEFTGASSGHHNMNEVLSPELLNDLTYIKKGEKYNNLSDEIITVDVLEAKEVSAKYELDNGVDNKNTYYVRISTEETRGIENTFDENVEDIPNLEIPITLDENLIPEENILEEEPTIPTAPTEPEDTKPTVPTAPTEPENNKPTVPTASTEPENTKPTVPIAPIEPENINILPENKFSNVLPEITWGYINSMEISKSFVTYKIGGVLESNYNDYIFKLQEYGYEFINNKWVKDNYQIVLSYENDTILLSASINQ